MSRIATLELPVASYERAKIVTRPFGRAIHKDSMCTYLRVNMTDLGDVLDVLKTEGLL